MASKLPHCIRVSFIYKLLIFHPGSRKRRTLTKDEQTYFRVSFLREWHNERHDFGCVTHHFGVFERTQKGISGNNCHTLLLHRDILISPLEHIQYLTLRHIQNVAQNHLESLSGSLHLSLHLGAFANDLQPTLQFVHESLNLQESNPVGRQ